MSWTKIQLSLNSIAQKKKLQMNSSIANAVLFLLLTSLRKKDPDLIGVINFKKCFLCHK